MMPVPLISHEIGQYSIYPDLKEIEKYTGVLSPLNFKAVRQDLQQKNLLDEAPSFTKASGKFAVELYKEEIERAPRTETGYWMLDDMIEPCLFTISESSIQFNQRMALPV